MNGTPESETRISIYETVGGLRHVGAIVSKELRELCRKTVYATPCQKLRVRFETDEGCIKVFVINR